MKITDELLYRHAPEARDLWLSTFPEEGQIPEHTFSPEFDREMDRLVSLSRKKKKPFRSLRRIAAVFAALLIGTGSWLTVDVQAREAFTRWIRGAWEDGVVYNFVGEAPDDTIPDFHCSWLPEGMQAIELTCLGDQGHLTYMGEDDAHAYLMYSYMHDGTAHFITPTGEDGLRHEVVEINGLPGDFYIEEEAGHSHVLLWFDEQAGISFTLHSPLPPEDILHMAESVREGTVLELMPEYVLDWLPDGYDEGRELSRGSHARKISSLSEEKVLSLEYEIMAAATLEEQFRLDPETPGIPVTIRGEEGVLYLNTHREEHSLLWPDSEAGIAFRLDAAEDMETMTAIAEGVTPR